MKRILLLFVGITIALLSCNRVERVESLSQLELGLRKHVGNPIRIDTLLKDEWHINYNNILYSYDDVSDVTFEQLASFLSKAYEYEPVLSIEEKRRTAEFIPIPDNDGAYTIQLVEWFGSKDNKRHLGFCILDTKNELVTPSSQTLQTSALSK